MTDAATDFGRVVFDTQVVYLVHWCTILGSVKGEGCYEFHSIPSAGSATSVAASSSSYLIYHIFSKKATSMILFIFRCFVCSPRMRVSIDRSSIGRVVKVSG